jgi:hypothetical protein
VLVHASASLQQSLSFHLPHVLLLTQHTCHGTHHTQLLPSPSSSPFLLRTRHITPPTNAFQADLREHPPVLDWGTQHGPKTMLYDLCQDPQETRNLATTEHGKRLAERLYHEVLETIKDAVRAC